jgi:hypothetical protein
MLIDQEITYVSPEVPAIMDLDLEGTLVNVYGDPCPEPDPPDIIAPVIDNYDPAPGTQIGVADTLQFDVTDNKGELTLTLVEAFFEDTGASEVVHDGEGFRPYYATSSRTVITNGYHFSLQRRGGWPASPTIRVYAVDEDGNEA